MAIILVVDDSKVMREMVKAALVEQGHEIITAEDGHIALEIAKETTVDMVLSDVNMPNMSGISLVSQLRLLTTYTQTPIIMLTTESTDSKKTKAKLVGASGWLQKPFDQIRLIKTVKTVLAKAGHILPSS
jgi:two-component system, chemotaxis family, chemotaxis protein CheY